MRIAAGGNVLINTTTDSGYKLDVSGTGRFSGDLLVKNTTTHAYLNIDAAALSAAEAGVMLRVGGTDKWEIYTANNDGNLSFWSAGQGIKFKIEPTGAATFSSSVTARQGIINGLGGSRYQMLTLTAGGTSDEGLFITTTGTGNDYYAIKVATGGSANSFAVTNAGNVGIGTTAPAKKLSVQTIDTATYDPAVNAAEVSVTRANTSNTAAQVAGISLNATGWSGGTTGVVVLNAIQQQGNYSNADFAIQNRVGGSFVETFRITAYGDVGIGASSPGTFLQLGTYSVAGKYIDQATYPDIPSEHMMHITAPSTNAYYGGGISFGETAFTAANIVVRDAGSSGALDMCFGTGTSAGVTEKMRITNAGNVGIGTTSPNNAKLVISDTGSNKISIDGGTSQNGMRWEAVGGANTFYLYNGTSGTAGFGLYNVNTAATPLWIQNGGNVGIGTTGPIAKLHVNATNVLGGSSGDFTILSTLQNSGGSGGNNLYENNWSYRTATGTDWPTWSLWNGISVDASFVTPTTSLTWHWREPNAGKHHFGNGGTNVMTIGPSNVGIGTTAPVSTLQIVATTTEQTTSELTDAGSRKGLLTLSGLSNQVAGAGGGIVFAGNTTTSYAAIKGLLSSGGGNTIGNIAFSTRNATTDTALTERMRISAAGAIQFNAYGVGLLVTDASGNITATSTIPGSDPGPYLALAGGTMTGVLSMGNAGTYSHELKFTNNTLTGGIDFQNNGTLRFIDRSTNTVGAYINLISGEFATYSAGNAITNLLSTNGNSYFNGGNVGIGTSNPSSKLEVNVTDDTFNDIDVLILKRTWATGSGSDRAHGILFSDANSRMATIYADRTNSGSNYNSQLLFSVNSGASGTSMITPMVINNLGRVGIGTTSPATYLEVTNATLATDTVNTLLTQRWSRKQTGAVKWGNSIDLLLGSYESGTINSRTRVDFMLANGATDVPDTTVLTLQGNGNVGIGTTSPGKKLEVAGSYKLGTNAYIQYDAAYPYTITTANTAGVGNLVFSAGLGSAAYESRIDLQGTNVATTAGITLSTAGSSRIVVTNEGNVGIGTTSPTTAKLQIANPNAGSDGSQFQRWVYTAGNAGVYELHLKQTVTSGVVRYNFSMVNASTAYNDVLVLDRGNVGIGTTSPNAKLEVNSAITFSSVDTFGQLVVKSASGSTGDMLNIGVDTTNSVAFIQAVERGIDTIPLSLQRYGGNVGIGTDSPGTKLSIRATTASHQLFSINRANTDTAALYIGNDTGDDAVIAVNNGELRIGKDLSNTFSEYVRIDDSGNVGIGITAPLSLLHVAGDARITSGSLGVGVAPNATDGRIDASNDIVAFQTSDRRLKENITPIANALEKVRSLTGVMFDWKEETKHVHGYEGHDVGIIAQDVQAVLPEAVRTNDTGYLSVRYEKMIALLIEANKELATRVEELEAKLK
jgi:hypothetical protein